VVSGKFSVTFPLPRSRWLKTKVGLKFFLAITWLLEGLSKQSLGFVNSEGYLAIEASRWRLSQTTCWGNAFAVRTGWKYSGPNSTFSLAVSLSHTHTHTHTQTHVFMVNMVGAGKTLAHFLWAPLSTLFLPPPLSPKHTPHHSPQTLPSEPNSWTGEGFPAGPDLSCKKMTHLLKNPGKREKRRFQERKHKQRWFNMMVASGTQRKAGEGKGKIAYDPNPLNDRRRPEARSSNLVFRAWMQKNGFCACLIIFLFESRSKWRYIFFSSSIWYF